MTDETLDRLIAMVGHYGPTNETMFQMSVQLAEARTELARLRAVLDAATAAERGNWNGCKAALFETGGDA